MKHQQHQRTLLCMAVASACAMFALPAVAQQNDSGGPATAPQPNQQSAAPTPTPTQTPAPAPSSDGQVQAVVVTGFRSSLEKALDLKRSQIGIRDSIVAEDIGKFPEQNIADALVRLPGVEVVKDGASNEGQRIQLRGLGSEYTVTTFNGAPVRATSAGGIGGASRDFNYDVFPSELFGRVDVYKTPLAELEEGGVAGVVDLQTPRPFDKKGQVIRYGVAESYNSKSKFKSPRANVLYSNTWGNWGFLASVAQNQTHNGNAGFQSTGTYANYNQRFTTGNFPYAWNLSDPRAKLGSLTTAQLFDGNLPRFFRITATDNIRKRIGAATSLQYKNNDLDISFDSVYSQLRDDTKNNYLNFVTNGATGLKSLVPIDVRVDQNNNLQGTVGNFTASTNTVMGKSETKFRYNSLNAKYKVSPDLRVNGSIAVNQSDAWRSDATVTLDASDAAVRHTLTFDTSKDAMFPDVSTDRDLLDPKIYNSLAYSGSYRTETDKQKTFRGNLAYDYNFWDIKSTLKTGASQVKSTKIANQYVSLNLMNNQTIPGVGSYATATAPQQVAFARTFFVPNDLNKIKVGGNVPQDWLTVDRNFVYNTLNAVDANRNAAANLGGTFEATETVRAFYVSNDFEKAVFGRPLRANVGVRYLKTDTDIDNYAQAPNSGYAPAHLEGSYTNTLPSASLSYDLTSDLVLRGSVGKTIKRSSISSIARSINVPNGGDLVVQAGNPNLRPESSTNLDAAAEWYFEKGSALALSAFRKNIKDRPVTTSIFVPFNSLGIAKELFTPNNQTNLAANPDTPIELRLAANAESFNIKGLELFHQQNYKFLPYPFNNLGSILSLTSIRTAGVNRVYNNVSYELPIVPERTIAATVYYEEGPFSLRTSYNHKSAFANFSNTALNPLGYQRWFNARGYLDASIGYKINKLVEIRIDGSNLTNTRTYETLRHFEGRFGDENSRLEGANQSGRTIALSLRGSL